jgi:hypothetical protein
VFPRGFFSRAIGRRPLALGVGLVLLAVAAVPFRLEVQGPHRFRPGLAGVTFGVERVTVGLLPWEHVALLDVKAHAPLPGGDNLEIAASRVHVDAAGVGIYGLSLVDGPMDRLVAEQLRGRLGPIPLADGDLEVHREGTRLKLRGWAAGAHGGRVDVHGNLSANSPYTGRIRLYASKLRFIPGLSMEPLEFSGSVTVDRQGEGTGFIQLALDVTGPNESGALRMSARPQATTDRFVSRVEGTLQLQAGKFTPESVLSIRGHMRDFRTAPETRSIHGPFHGSLGLAGTMEHLQGSLDLDLTGVRIRLGDRLDKAADVPAQAELTVRIEEGEPLRANGQLLFDSLRARIGAVARSDRWSWTFETDWSPLTEILEQVPFLQKAPLPSDGRVRAVARGREGGTPSMRIEFADLSVPIGAAAVRIPRARVWLDQQGIHLGPTLLDLGGEALEVSGDLRLPRERVGWELALHARAGRVQLEPLLAFLGPQSRPAEAPPPDMEKAAVALVRRIHASSFVLQNLTVRPLVLEIEELKGLGLAERAVRIEAGLEDRVIRVELDRAGASAGPQTFCLDLRPWLPQLSTSEVGMPACPGLSADPRSG